MDKETVKQIQRLLKALGSSPGDIDGIWGKKSQAALLDALKKHDDSFDTLVETTLPLIEADKVDYWKDIKYFSRSEFRCHCGGKYCNGYPVEPSEKLVRLLDKIREKCGCPVTVNSGIRCAKHNASIEGSAKASQHLYGTAADLHCSGKSVAEMQSIAEKLLGESGGIGTYSWGIHVDVRPSKSRWKG